MSLTQQTSPAEQPEARVILADDHAVVLHGIRNILLGEPSIRVLSMARNVDEIFAGLERQLCNVLLTDFSFDGDEQPDGLDMLLRIARMYPDLKIILLTMHDDPVVIRQAMAIGVVGFISKNHDDLAMLPNVIRRAMNGQKYVDPVTARGLVERMFDRPKGLSPQFDLTPRELEVLRLYKRGMSQTDIARHTHRSIKTISAQKSSAMKKLGAKNDIELIEALGRLV
ncbi:response regulator [Paraherbaspirillum soli]|uniref:Response regulator n=1 Tax=Paraherbaspirillum soli TaxID=631222 RepID=A0ABW0MHD5_9BURK